MRAFSLMVIGLIGAASVATGCSSSSAPALPATSRAACDAYYDALRAWSDRCAQGSPDRFLPSAVVLENCARLVGAKGSSYTISRLSACASQVRAAACQALNSEVAQCLDGAGTLPDDAACADRSQCASDACVLQAGKACGVCKAMALEDGACGDGVAQCKAGLACAQRHCVAARSGEGGPCVSYGDGPTCQDGFGCVRTAPSVGVCAVAPKLGKSCTTLCEGGASCEKGICVGALAEGASCAPAAVCDAGKCAGPSVCVAGLICDDIDKRCAAPVVTSFGDPCDVSARICPDNGYCAEYNGVKRGECRPRPALGESCSDTDAPCQVGLLCVDARCARRDPSVCQ